MYNPETFKVDTVTIATGEQTSTVIDKRYYGYVTIFLPANWVTSTITFTGCDTIDGTFTQVVKASDVGALTIANVAASKCIVLDGAIIEGILAIPFIKLVAGTTQTATDKIIKIGLRR